MQLKSMIIWALRREQTKAMIRYAADVSTRLDRFNAVWQDAVENVPFYAEWKMKHGLPGRIEDLSELQGWPVLEKKDLILNRDKLTRRGVTKFHESVTGGATGEPLHFRTMPGDSLPSNTNLWIGRARMDIFPDTRTFLLWGHRHFYGQGWRSDLRFKIRQLKDWVTNHVRVDATDLSVGALRHDVDELIRFKPECVYAYSASLLALVRTCKERVDECRALKLKAIICTAGPLDANERMEISEFFAAPVGMEYGSMEGGVMAYQTPVTNCRYQVFDTHLIQTMPEPVTGNDQVLVTKLYKSYLPLIRYRLGDYIEGACVDEAGFVVRFDEVLGRTGDEVDMGNGIKFHGQSFMTCAEGFDKVVAYQIRVNRRLGRVTFVAQTIAPLSEEEKKEIVKRSAHMSGLTLDSIHVEETAELVKAPSGKIRLVITEDAP